MNSTAPFLLEREMTDSDRFLLQRIINQEKAANSPRSTDQTYFELFSAEQILKDGGFDLDPEQLRSGLVGNGGDGGVDSFYIFANRKLVREDQDISAFKDQQLAIEIVIIQSKLQNSFGEATIQKLTDFTDNCLRLNASPEVAQRLYNERLRDTVSRFHTVYYEALSARPTLTITYFYASLSEHVHPQVQERADLLIQKCNSHFSAAEVSFQFVGGARLLNLFNRAPTKTLSLETTKNIGLSAFGTAYVCLVSLRSFYKFITDDDGSLRGPIFEANVRDYQGDVAVNKGIASTLAVVGSEEFWWLNNGITILASETKGAGDFITITDPLIVNGLQTSYEIYNHFRRSKADDKRTILVRVIQSTDSQSVDRIIQATNSQTQIPRIWLHATEDIHRKIELALKTEGLYYDRRKNHYRNQGIPSSKIVTIPYLSQAIAAIVLQRPDDARARPTTVADRHYKQMFSDNYAMELYPKCALLLKRVDDFLDGVSLGRNEKNNLIYHLAMYVSAVAAGSANPNRRRIASLDMGTITEKLLSESMSIVEKRYTELGGNDRVAKGPPFAEALKNDLRQRFVRQKRK